MTFYAPTEEKEKKTAHVLITFMVHSKQFYSTVR